MTAKMEVPPGTRYGLLTVIGEKYQVSPSGKRLRMQECRCDCGNITVVTTGNPQESASSTALDNGS